MLTCNWEIELWISLQRKDKPVKMGTLVLLSPLLQARKRHIENNSTDPLSDNAVVLIPYFCLFLYLIGYV